MIRFYVKERLGPKQSLTPEGFLLCEDVPINRTGLMLYGPGETPISVGPDGIARIEREETEVFRPETIVSFEGKPVTIHHPDSDVNPDNWSNLAVGVVLHPRRGPGILDDTMLADLLITHKDAISEIRENGLREVSCGYDADYEEMAPGRGRQRNIVGNHVALVEAGRCGPRCAIGDQKTVKEQESMNWLERLKAAFKAKDEAAFDAALSEAPKEPQLSEAQISLIAQKVRDASKEEEEEEGKKKTMDAAIEERFKKTEDALDAIAKDVKDLKSARDEESEAEKKAEEERKAKETKDKESEEELKEEAPKGEGEKASKARDSAFLEESFQETTSLAEIISPGVKIPTFDRASEPKKTYDAMCQFRRTVLDLAYAQPEARVFMDELLQGRELKSMDCKRVRDTFLAVGAFKKQDNNSKMRDRRDADRDMVKVSPITSPTELNKKNAEYWAKH